MPVHVRISQLDRLVTIVVRGPLTADDVARCTGEWLTAGGGHFCRIIDICMSPAAFADRQLDHVAKLAASSADGPVHAPFAVVVDDEVFELARSVADAPEGQGRTRLFRSLHEARLWLGQARIRGQRSLSEASPNQGLSAFAGAAAAD